MPVLEPSHNERCSYCGLADPGPEHRSYAPALCAEKRLGELTRADLERELHYMQTQVEQHGYPGTRAVLAELERLRTENARLIAVLRAIQRLKAKWRAPIRSRDIQDSNARWAAVGSEAHKLACDALDNAR